MDYIHGVETDRGALYFPKAFANDTAGVRLRKNGQYDRRYRAGRALDDWVGAVIETYEAGHEPNLTDYPVSSSE